MSTTLSKHVESIAPSPTLSIDAKAKKLRAAGHSIINLSVGEPDFDTPEFIKAAAVEALAAGHTKYTPFDGIPALKAAIIHKFERDNQLSYAPSNILVSTGLKQSLYNITHALLNADDEAIIPAPYWVSYPAMVKLAGAQPVILKTTAETQLKITPTQLAAAITPNTRLLFLNSPSNPSGMAYSKEELLALGEVLREHPRVMIVSDDIYEYIFWGKSPFANILNACPDLKDRVIIGNGLSKAYAMTGFRIGYVAGPEFLINGMKKIQSQSTGCPNSIAQHAAVAALNADPCFFDPLLDLFKTRYQLLFDALNAIDGVHCLPTDGTFYLFPDVSEALQRVGIADDLALAERLLDEAGLAVVPGTAFGMPHYLRLSFATHETDLMQAAESIKKVFSS